MQMAYPWGNNFGSNHANCNGCGSHWDNKQSAPVGSFDKTDLIYMIRLGMPGT